VSTSVGFLFSVCLFLNVSWWQFIIPVALFFLVLYFFKMVSLASISAFITASLVTLFLPIDWIIKLTIIVLAILIIIRHHENIQRIRNNEESKITWM